MGKKAEIKVLQLESSTEWRGGQQQIAYLIKGLLQVGVTTAIACRPQAQIFSYSQKHHWPVVPIKMRHSFDFTAAFKIAQFFKKNGFNILHAHSSHALTLSLIVKKMLPSLKLIAARRVDFSVRKPLIGVFKYNNRLIDRIVCVSENVAHVLQKDGVSSHKLTVIHSGIDIERFRNKPTAGLRNELQIPEDHLVVGTVAALVGHKDYPTLLRAAAQVIHKWPKVTFCAVGDGEERARLMAMAQKLKLSSRFRFVGFRTDLERFYNLFDLFVMSSHMEGLGTAILDAMACGLPVVATRAGGIPEIVGHQSNGLLVPPKDPPALAQAILELLQNVDLRVALAKRARQSVKKFSYQTMVQKHIQLYQQVLAADFK